MPKSNPGREIAWSLGAAVVLGGGFYFYLAKTIEPPQPIKLVTTFAASAAQAASNSRPEAARLMAATFVQHLAAARFENAYGLMSNGYRQTTSLDVFRAACTGSPFLSTATSVSLSRIREERAKGDNGPGSLSGVGVLMSRAGTIDTTFFFVDDPSGVAIVNVVAAGTSLLPMAVGTVVKSGPSRDAR